MCLMGRRATSAMQASEVARYPRTRRAINARSYEVADKAGPCKHLDGEEIGRGDGSPVGFQERLPSRLSISLRSGLKASVNQDTLDGVSADVVPEVEQSAADAGVAPARIIGGHGADELGDVTAGCGPAGTTPTTSVVLLRDEVAVPTGSVSGVTMHATPFNAVGPDLAKRFVARGRAARRCPMAPPRFVPSPGVPVVRSWSIGRRRGEA
jgi:hypothetical protein